MIIAVLQARIGSSRFPGKVLANILGQPLLVRQIERIARARLIDRLVVATTGRDEDDAIAHLAGQLRIDCYRGSVDDVLDRYYQCAKRYDADHIVRLTADCAFLDPQVIDDLVRMHLREANSYSSNTQPKSYPQGLEAEIMSRKTLAWVWENATQVSEREDVTSFIHNNPELLRIGNLQNQIDHSALRWTIVERNDLNFTREIYAELYPENPAFTTQDVLDYLNAHPEIGQITSETGPNLSPSGERLHRL
ncbi:MAG: glycosyltransferase family protein [Sphingomonadales bacterium]|jgi:spore coat polysaccharide biosynthesis protein SpsF